MTGLRPAQLVSFPAHREYDDRKNAANNAMMALLAGAQLSSHFLQLTEGSDQLLPRIFPNVDHIKRFNLKTDAATEILKAADTHLGMMAVPYVLSLHEDYLRTCASMLAAESLCTRAAARVNLVGLHDTIADACGGTFTSDLISYIKTLRLMRNSVIHAGAQASQELINELATWTPPLVSGWLGLAHRDPTTLGVGDVLELGHGEMIVALMVTKRLDREANVMLQGALPRSTWIRMVLDEADEVSPGITRRADSGKAFRKARGIANFYYKPLALTDLEIQAALTAR